MYGPEALVVGVVGHCPAKLLLRVQQLARASRSGINQRQHLNVQHQNHYHQVFTLKLVDLIICEHLPFFHRQLQSSLRF